MIAVIVSSLVLNYLLVFTLTVCRIYVRPVLIVILLAEIGVIGWIYRREFSQPLGNSVGFFLAFCSRIIQRIGGIFTRKTGESTLDTLVRGIYNAFCIFLALVSLNWIWKLFTWNLGSTFDSYDTVAEWNRWAMDWAANTCPPVPGAIRNCCRPTGH
jgi:cbb3-type cytochrome oxidase subunit 3